MFKKPVLAAALLTAFLACGSPPAAAQDQTAPTRDKTTTRDLEADAAKKKAVQGVDFEFVDSEEAYWVTRTLNDTLFTAGYSPNAVAEERGQSRGDDVVKRNFKPARVADLDVKARQKPAPTQSLMLNGKLVDVRR